MVNSHQPYVEAYCRVYHDYFTTHLEELREITAWEGQAHISHQMVSWPNVKRRGCLGWLCNNCGESEIAYARLRDTMGAEAAHQIVKETVENLSQEPLWAPYHITHFRRRLGSMGMQEGLCIRPKKNFGRIALP